MAELTLDLREEITIDEESKQIIPTIKRALHAIADQEELPAVEVSLTLVDDERIQELNATFRGIDRPTDVLSFPLWEPDEEWVISSEETAVALGDIIISFPQAVRQAIDYGHSLERELCFLAVHGFLHLLGYDHETDVEEKEMFAIQEQILENIGVYR